MHMNGVNSEKTDHDEYRLRLNYRYQLRYRVTGEQTLEIEVFYLGHRRRLTDEPSTDNPS